MGNPRSIGLAAIAAITYCATISCAPPHAPTQGEVAAVLSALILRPDRTCAEMRQDFGLGPMPLVDTPAEVGIAYEEHSLLTPDGEQLHLWYLPAAHERGVVVLSAGNSGSMTCYLFTAWLLWRGGWSVVMYDYEGFGESTGTPSLLTLRSDLDAVVDWTRTQKGYPQVTLMGISLGSIPSIALAVEQPDAVNGVVLDSPVALGAGIERFNVLLAGRGDEILALLEPWLDTEATIAQMTQPLLVYEDGQDMVTPPATVERLYDLAPGPKRIVRFPDLGHARGQFFSTATYALYLDLFLTSVWGEP